MPRAKWTPKDERKYRHILTSCQSSEEKKAQRHARGCEPCSILRKQKCQRIAAATVNRDRAVRKAARR